MKISTRIMMESKGSLENIETLPLDAATNLELMYMEDDFEKRTKIAQKLIKAVNEKYAVTNEKGEMLFENGLLMYLDKEAAEKEIKAILDEEFEVVGTKPIAKVPYEFMEKANFPRKILKDLRWLIDIPVNPTQKKDKSKEPVEHQPV